MSEPAPVADGAKEFRTQRIPKYLRSECRIPFNEDGIFRHYPELDG